MKHLCGDYIFVVVLQTTSNSSDIFTRIHQYCFTGIGANVTRDHVGYE